MNNEQIFENNGKTYRVVEMPNKNDNLITIAIQLKRIADMLEDIR